MKLINKRCKLFYSDGNSVQVRIGIVTEETNDFYVVENNVLIPKKVLIRVEVVDERE